MIKWILFDLAGVVVKMYFGRTYLVLNKQKFDSKIFHPIYQGALYEDYMIGNASEMEVITDFLKRSKITLSSEEIKHLLKDNAAGFIKGMPKFIIGLRKKYKIACLSNEGREWLQYKIDKLNLNKLFDNIIESNQLHVLKNSEKFFIKSLELIKAKPSECIFIDDKPANCAIANKVGIKSIIFKNTEQLKKELTSLDSVK